MNTGLALRKHGESRLGLLMRLWLSNRGHFKIGKTSIRELLGDVVSRDEQLKNIDFDNQLSDFELLINVVNQLEIGKASEYSKVFGEMYWGNTIKNCSECAKVGFHSGYSNAPWVSKCPIHNIQLTEKCPDCLNYWPNFSDLRLRNCQTCGVRKSSKKLQSLGAYDLEKFYYTSCTLITLFENEILEIEEQISEYNFWSGGFNMIKPHKHLSPSYPSFVCAYDSYIRKEEEELTNKLGIAIYPMWESRFTLNYQQNGFYDSKSMENDILQSRLKVLCRAEEELLNAKKLNHKFRSCFGNFFDPSMGCACCKTYDIIVDALSADGFFRRNELFRYYIYETYRHIIKEPGVVYTIGVGDQKCMLPTDIMFKLYEIELWTQIRVLYYKLKAASNCSSNEANLSSLDWANRNPRIAESQNSYTFPFYFVRQNKSKTKLFIPETFLSNSIDIDDDFIKMYFQ